MRVYIFRRTNSSVIMYMGKYPVIFLSLKGVEGFKFEEARFCLAELIAGEARRFKFLLDSDKLDQGEKDLYRESAFAVQGTGFCDNYEAEVCVEKIVRAFISALWPEADCPD